jgi:PncC family amidohydrolase
MQVSLEGRIAEALWSSGKTVCTAESCTGGLIAHRLTNIPGSSAYMKGGVIAYSAFAKQQLLNVRTATMEMYGEVSTQAASEMAIGAVRLFEADYALSVTGIAGPGGGTPLKPVGLTYIALGGAGGILDIERHLWDGDRKSNKRLSANAALGLLLRRLEGGE